MLLVSLVLPQGCKLEGVTTECRRKIAHTKGCEWSICTDSVITPKHTAGCCGTFSGQLLAVMDSLKGLVCFHSPFSVFMRLSFSFSSKQLFLTAVHLLLLPLASYPLHYAQINLFSELVPKISAANF